MPAEQLACEDVAVAEQRREMRIIVSIPGRYSLADVRDARGERRVFACRAVNLSAQSITLAGPVNGKIGARVIADIVHLGRVEGARAVKSARGLSTELSGWRNTKTNRCPTSAPTRALSRSSPIQD